MKRIEYENVKDYEREYLRTLGFLDEKGKATKDFKDLNKEWKNIRKDKNILSTNFPKNIKRLLIASYEKLICYFILLQKLDKSSLNEIKKKFDEKDTEKIFRYSKICDKIADFFKKNADKLKIHSCFYCDAAYTGVFSTEEEVRRTFDVDHFFPKSEYPMFSLSLYNFVPSCQVCNSRVKGRRNFIKFYSLEKDLSLRKVLSQISPAGKKYAMDSNLTIKVYPEKNDTTLGKSKRKINKKSNKANRNEGSETDSEWHYTPVFSKNLENYRILFDVNEKTAYKNVVSAFLLEERYNNIAIKSQALYLMDLKKKYPDSNIKFLSDIINKTLLSRNKRTLISPEEIKRTIFHNDNKYSLLQKLRNDIVDYDIFDEDSF